MAKTETVIEVNGRRYNAATGALLSHGGKSMDGFVVSTPIEPAHNVEMSHPDVTRNGEHHAHPHSVQHSKTLMRHAVHHPSDSLKRHAKSTTHTGALVNRPQFDIVPKHSAQVVDDERLRRAGQVAHSDYVRRFATNSAPLSHANAPFAARTGTPYPITETPRSAAPVQHQPSNDVFERALATANSHKQPYAPVKHKAKKSHRVRNFTSVAASALAIVLIVGFVAYQNSATIQFRLAASRAGITATLPTWQPSGFRVGTFAYSPGSVTLHYINAASGQTFSIAQTKSDWDNVALLDNFVYPNNETYNTISSAGTTIYTYGSNDAVWINHGLLYKLTSNGSLTTSQIVNLATSMQ